MEEAERKAHWANSTERIVEKESGLIARLSVSTFYSKKPIGIEVNGLRDRDGRAGGQALMALSIQR